MAYLDLRRMVRNYLPILYRLSAMETFIYSLVYGYEDLISRMEEARREHEAQQQVDLSIYSFEVVKRRILILYGIDPDNPPIFTKRVSLYENTYGRIVYLRFGTNYPHDTNYHYARIKDFFPAGILINIEYD